MKKVLLKIAIVIAIIAALLALPLGVFYCQEYIWYETHNINKYGKVNHVHDNTIPEEFIHSFFPETIEPYFSDVAYQYRARSWCEYGCEMQLSFTIENQQAYLDYVADVTEGLEGTVFTYDNRFIEYTVSDYGDVIRPYEKKDDYYLEGVKIGKILIDDAEQKIVYHAIVIADCCGTEASNLDFFSQYDIDIAEYTAQMDTAHP